MLFILQLEPSLRCFFLLFLIILVIRDILTTYYFFTKRTGYLDAILNFGNNCSHLKETPRFYAPHNVQRLPNFIQEAMTKCEDFYFTSKDYLTNLQKPLNEEKLRIKRSERREAISLTLQSLFNYMNVGNGEVGFWTKNTNKVTSIHCEFLARKTGLKRQRLYRAIADLKKAGYLAAHHTSKRSAKGIYRTVKFHITAPCLRHLGFSDYRIKQVQKFKAEVLRRQAPNSCEYQENHVELASAPVVQANVAKMKEMFKNLVNTKRKNKVLYPDFTGCANTQIKLPTEDDKHYPTQLPSERVKRPVQTLQSREKMRQQVAQVLHLVRNGLSMEAARQQVGL